MKTNWWWVRHGPTHAKVFTGWRDVPADLSDIDQIKRLKNFLPKNAVLICSDLKRAIATADVINDGKDIIVDPNLREFNFGLWDGLDFNEVAGRDPIKSKDFWEKPGDTTAPEGESWNMVKNRVSEAVKKYTAIHKGSNIVAVAHFGVILTQVQLALGKSPNEVLSNKIDNLSVTKIQINAKGSSLTKLNYTP